MASKNIKQVIVMRSDLKNLAGHKVRTGKLIAQGAHASMAFLTRTAEFTATGMVVKFPKPAIVKQWCQEGFTKVTLKVNSEDELIDIYRKAKAANLPVELIQDSGLTEFDGIVTKTCIAIGPAFTQEIDKVTGHLNLF